MKQKKYILLNIDEKIINEQRFTRDIYYKKFLKTEDIEIPGVEDVLACLSKKFSMAIVTTSKRDDFEIIHKKRNFLKFMDFCITREDYKNSKPSPEPYLMGMKRFNTIPEECIVIEDSARGLKASIGAGIDCVIVDNEFTKTHDFSGAKYGVKKIGDLPELLMPRA